MCVFLFFGFTMASIPVPSSCSSMLDPALKERIEIVSTFIEKLQDAASGSSRHYLKLFSSNALPLPITHFRMFAHWHAIYGLLCSEGTIDSSLELKSLTEDSYNKFAVGLFKYQAFKDHLDGMAVRLSRLFERLFAMTADQTDSLQRIGEASNRANPAATLEQAHSIASNDHSLIMMLCCCRPQCLSHIENRTNPKHVYAVVRVSTAENYKFRECIQEHAGYLECCKGSARPFVPVIFSQTSSLIEKVDTGAGESVAEVFSRHILDDGVLKVLLR